MGFIKIVNKPYDTKESLNNLIYYIANYSEFIGGCGISVLSLESVISEFETIKKVFNKAEEGRRQVRHFIISFRYGEMNIEFIKKIAWEMAKYYGNKFQVFYGIHLNTDTPHIHFAVNSVSFVDGKMLSEGYYELENNRQLLQKFEYECKMPFFDA